MSNLRILLQESYHCLEAIVSWCLCFRGLWWAVWQASCLWAGLLLELRHRLPAAPSSSRGNRCPQQAVLGTRRSLHSLCPLTGEGHCGHCATSANSMEHSRLPSQEIPSLLWTLKFRCYVKRVLHRPLSWARWIQFTHFIFKIYFNIILPTTPTHAGGGAMRNAHDVLAGKFK
jgi:hypothetical protein